AIVPPLSLVHRVFVLHSVLLVFDVRLLLLDLIVADLIVHRFLTVAVHEVPTVDLTTLSAVPSARLKEKADIDISRADGLRGLSVRRVHRDAIAPDERRSPRVRINRRRLNIIRRR